jgi:hypothetical protein
LSAFKGDRETETLVDLHHDIKEDAFRNRKKPSFKLTTRSGSFEGLLCGR